MKTSFHFLLDEHPFFLQSSIAANQLSFKLMDLELPIADNANTLTNPSNQFIIDMLKSARSQSQAEMTMASSENTNATGKSAANEDRALKKQLDHKVATRASKVKCKWRRQGQDLQLMLSVNDEHYFQFLIEQRHWPRAISAENILKAALPGTIRQVQVKPGDRVKRDQTLLVIEAMKMETAVKAPLDGTVKNVQVKQDEFVPAGQAMIELDYSDPDN